MARLKVAFVFMGLVWTLGAQGKPNCPSLFRKIGGMFLDKSILISLTAGGLVAGAELIGQFEKTPHLGLSIFFDYENILNAFTPSERNLIEKAKDHPERAIEILIAKLSARSNDSLEVWPYLRPLMASQYFSEDPPPTNVCRHKALVLNALLNRLGLQSRLITGTIQGDSGRGGHVWVFLPELNKVADPMNGAFLEKSDFQEAFQAEENLGVMQFPRLIGIMAR